MLQVVLYMLNVSFKILLVTSLIKHSIKHCGTMQMPCGSIQMPSGPIQVAQGTIHHSDAQYILSYTPLFALHYLQNQKATKIATLSARFL